MRLRKGGRKEGGKEGGLMCFARRSQVWHATGGREEGKGEGLSGTMNGGEEAHPLDHSWRRKKRTNERLPSTGTQS